MTPPGVGPELDPRARVHADPPFAATIIPVGDGLLVAGWRGDEAGATVGV